MSDILFENNQGEYPSASGIAGSSLSEILGGRNLTFRNNKCSSC